MRSVHGLAFETRGLSRRTNGVFWNDAGMFSQNVGTFLRRLYPLKSAARVAADTGLSEWRVAKWLEGTSSPSGLALLKLVAVYGPEFLAAVMPDRFVWIDEAVLRRQMQELDLRRAEADILRAQAQERLLELAETRDKLQQLP